MKMHYVELAEIVKRDPRFPFEAYDFVRQALLHTQKMLGRSQREDPGPEGEVHHHVSGRELCEGIRDLALREFGMMARTVFHMWGIRRTDDFGDIVFNLVEANLLSKTDQDDRGDFHNLFDLDQALMQGFRIQLDEAD